MSKRIHAGKRGDSNNTTGKELADILNAALDSQDVSNETLSVIHAAMQDGLRQYDGTSNMFPIVTDTEGRILLGINLTTGKVFGNFEKLEADFDLSDYGSYEQVSGDVIALLTDVEGRVLIGYNVTTKSAVIHGFETVNIDPVHTPAELNHVMSYGQSLSVGASAGGVISTTQPYANLTFQGGPRAYDGDWSFAPLKALIEDTNAAPDGVSGRGETICSGLANYAALANMQKGISPEDHRILASAPGHGGYSISKLNRGTAWYNDVFLRHVTEAHAINTSHKVTAVTWMQGEADNVWEVDRYYTDFVTLHQDMNKDIRAITGQSEVVPFFTYQMAFGSKASGNVQQAQFLAAKRNRDIHMGPPLYLIEHAGDNTHLTAKGYKHVGAYFGRAYSQLLTEGKVDWLKPLYVELGTDKLIVHFDVPTLPLRFDALETVADEGFAVFKDGVKQTISAVTITDSTVVIDLSAGATASGTFEVTYGMEYTPASMTVNGAGAGTLTDSTADSVVIDGEDITLLHACPYFRMTAHILEI